METQTRRDGHNQHIQKHPTQANNNNWNPIVKCCKSNEIEKQAEERKLVEKPNEQDGEKNRSSENQRKKEFIPYQVCKILTAYGCYVG